MLKIGLTGGIGSGKSTVAKIFNLLGIPVFDADAEAKKIMLLDAGLRKSIVAEFGEEAYSENELNRAYIANIVFNDPYRLEKLNAIVHPATVNAANIWMQNQTTSYVIKEAALMFEAGSTINLDFIIGVFSPKNLRIKRVMDRGNITREQVMARMDKQISDEIKMKLCDFVLTNDEQQLLLPQVIALHEKFLDLPRMHE